LIDFGAFELSRHDSRQAADGRVDLKLVHYAPSMTFPEFSMKKFALALTLSAAFAFALGTAVAHEGVDHGHNDVKSTAIKVDSSAMDCCKKGEHKHHDAKAQADCCKKDGKLDCCKKHAAGEKMECCKKHAAGEKMDCCKKGAVDCCAKDAKVKTSSAKHGNSACCKKAGTADANKCCKKHDAGIEQECCKKGVEKKS
jgi:hypothetical protein